MLDYQELTEFVIGRERLQPYGSLNPVHIRETLARYLWNMGLCESMYLPLNALEIALRNRVQHTLSARLGKERWWDPKWKLLPRRELSQVAVAMNRIKRDGRHPNIGRVVSGLTLGFWVGLFAARHEQKLWKGNALRMTFPHAPRRELGYHRLRARLNGFRHLRNRVFHHEPIWRWTQLDASYDNILELTAWLSTDMHVTLQPHDRFAAIYRAGYRPYLDKLP